MSDFSNFLLVDHYANLRLCCGWLTRAAGLTILNAAGYRATLNLREKEGTSQSRRHSVLLTSTSLSTQSFAVEPSAGPTERLGILCNCTCKPRTYLLLRDGINKFWRLETDHMLYWKCDCHGWQQT